MYIFITFGVLFLIYYRIFAVKKPQLYYSANLHNLQIISACPALTQLYRPPIWGFNRHIQIILLIIRQIIVARSAKYHETSTVVARDGGTTSIDWFGQNSQSAECPVVVMLPTICGDSQDLLPHVKFFHKKTGWTIAVCNRRGHGDLKLTVAKINILGCVDDFEEQLIYIKMKFPNAPIYAYGLSAGTGLLVRYLGCKGKHSRIEAAVANSPGYNTEMAFQRLRAPYDFILTRKLKKYFLLRHYTALAHHADYHNCLNTQGMAEFHQKIHSLAGYDTSADFFKDTNPMNEARSICVPLLVVNAKDDPVCVQQNIWENIQMFYDIPSAILALTARGSHCAFWEGWRGTTSWSDRVAVDFLLAVKNKKEGNYGIEKTTS